MDWEMGMSRVLFQQGQGFPAFAPVFYTFLELIHQLSPSSGVSSFLHSLLRQSRTSNRNLGHLMARICIGNSLSGSSLTFSALSGFHPLIPNAQILFFFFFFLKVLTWPELLNFLLYPHDPWKKKKRILFISKTRTGIFVRNPEKNWNHAAEGGSLSGIWNQVLALWIILGKFALGNLSVVSQFLNQPMLKKSFRISQVCFHEWQDWEERECT